MQNSPDFSQLNFLRLSENYSIKPFDCGDADLNDFLLNNSKDFLKALLAVTYLIENIEINNTIAFFSLLNDRIALKDTNNNKWNKIRGKLPKKKKLSSYPALKAGRLGVGIDYKGLGYGTAILDYLKVQLITNNKSGCRFLTVNAHGDSLKFYEKNGFQYLTDQDVNRMTRQMYFDLQEVLGNPGF